MTGCSGTSCGGKLRIPRKKKLQEALTLELRKLLDPVVEEAGYSPEDYTIVWKPLKPVAVITAAEEAS